MLDTYHKNSDLVWPSRCYKREKVDGMIFWQQDDIYSCNLRCMKLSIKII